MSFKMQNEIDALAAKVKTQGDAIVVVAYDVLALKEQVDQLTKLLEAMTRASTARGKAA